MTWPDQPFYSVAEHRPPTRFLQALLSWARDSAPLRVSLRASSSFVSCLLHVVFGRPLFLLPCGFHFKAYFAMESLSFLNVWPSHLNLRCFICWEILGCLVFSHSDWFEITSGQKMCRILLRHFLMKVWSLLSNFSVRKHGSKKDITTKKRPIWNYKKRPILRPWWDKARYTA